MPFRKVYSIFTIILVIVVCASLLNVRLAHADEGTPTEPPAPTQVETEPTTEPAAESTPEPVEPTATPLAELINQIPENTEVIVINENGDSIPLVTEEAAEIAEVVDPMWCPEGVLPGGPGCTTNFASISALINNMVSNTSAYTQNGVIYFTSNPGTGTFNLSPTTLSGGDFETLNDYNLTLKGGWNGDTVSPTFSGQTDFSNRPITIGTSANPWAGNITLSDIMFTGASQTSLTVYTTGDITLNNVDVNNQANGRNTALLNTTSGDIAISNGTHDGNNSNSAGLSATTVSGSITISDSSFTENKSPTPANTSNGATLSAPTVTLTNVAATGNDGNGIAINSANIVTLNSVVASSNGTDISPVGFTNNIGSGIFFNGNAGSNLFINSGTFNNNQEYGIELGDPANTTIYIQSAPTCIDNDSNAAPINSCSNGTFVTPIPPASPSGSGSGSSTSQSMSSSLIIPVTGGEVIRLDCNSTFWAFGIKLSFISLCGYQTTLNSVGINDLPGALPSDYSFVMGLNLNILRENQVLENLPDGAVVQMDFPVLGGSNDQFAVLYWNGSEWIEVPPQPGDAQGFYQVLTTDQTGIFVLVKK